MNDESESANADSPRLCLRFGRRFSRRDCAGAPRLTSPQPCRGNRRRAAFGGLAIFRRKEAKRAVADSRRLCPRFGRRFSRRDCAGLPRLTAPQPCRGNLWRAVFGGLAIFRRKEANRANCDSCRACSRFRPACPVSGPPRTRRRGRTFTIADNPARIRLAISAKCGFDSRVADSCRFCFRSRSRRAKRGRRSAANSRSIRGGAGRTLDSAARGG